MAKTVLIVEDDELNLRLFDAMLASEGYRTVTASSGAAALEAVKTRRPDLILMDIELDDASGFDIAASLKRQDRMETVPVVAVTAHAMRGDEARIRAKGCAGYIAKPVSMHGFLDAVRQFAQNDDGA
jgi:two-component system cell cycle response regulator DivK